MKSPAANKFGSPDMRVALALYKGGLSALAFKQSDQALALFHKLQSTVRNKIQQEEQAE